MKSRVPVGCKITSDRGMRHGNDTLAELAALMRWHGKPRLFSLAEMIRFLARDVHDAVDTLMWWLENTQRRIGELSPKDPERLKAIQRLIENVERVREFAAAMSLVATTQRCGNFVNDLRLSTLVVIPGTQTSMMPIPISVDVIDNEITGICSAFWDEMRNRNFAFIPPKTAEFFEQEALLGDAVNAAFPSAKEDLKDAGNCFAVGLHTAAVGHLLNAMNPAVHALARHLESDYKIPEHHDWGRIIKNLRKKLDEAHAKGHGRQADIEFYAGLLDSVSALKDIDRNPLSHGRKRYNEPEALAVYERVKSLMQRAATRLTG